jgi:hypothetical protein
LKVVNTSGRGGNQDATAAAASAFGLQWKLQQSCMPYAVLLLLLLLLL